jgi:hypothetical protein
MAVKSPDCFAAQLEQIIGTKGQANGGVYQFGVSRRGQVTESAMAIVPPGPMGLATLISRPLVTKKQLSQAILCWLEKGESRYSRFAVNTRPPKFVTHQRAMLT